MIKQTQHNTTNAEYIIGNLTEDIPKEVMLVEPFAGNGDLIAMFQNDKWERYDIDNTLPDNIVQDTLLNPPNYQGKYVITNPPYLASNKTKDKTYFEVYDDLYKLAIHTILSCEGGILIVPINFITDERSDKIRKEFFDKFHIVKLNVFSEPVFETTTYSVISFSFGRGKQTEPIETYLDGERIQSLILPSKFGYRLGGDFFKEIDKTKNIFTRLVNPSQQYQTMLYLTALDTRYEKISLTIAKPYIGIQTDRIYATLVSKTQIPIETQREITELFNAKLNNFRDAHSNLVLTNYRDFNRKRISFTFAYKLASLCYHEITNNSKE